LDHLEDCIDAMAEPMVSHDAIGFYLLSQEVSKETKVVLTGQGADEVFAGYHWYPKVMEGGEAVESYRDAFFDRTHEEILEALEPDFHCPDVSLEFVRRHFEAPGADEPVDKALRLDTRVMLVDDPVKRVDNMTMAWGLEARVPFLDHELVEMAASIPPQLKVKGTGKYILKKAAEKVVPREVIYRKKGYFPVPALKYLRGKTLEMAREVLTSKRACERGIFRRRHVERLLSEPEEHITVLGGSKLWQLALLELWLQRLEARKCSGRRVMSTA
jgi:asparagine synthase (glutamine-hydrolysing)